jgi:RIMS-binding protein 2
MGPQGASGGHRYGPAAAVPPHMRHGGRGRGTRVDAHGQVIIEPDENLSDKEIYPPSHMNIPSIGKQYHVLSLMNIPS